MDSDADVLIAGAGPTGLALALGLARRGIRSTVVEKNDALQPFSRAILMPARTLDILEEWGLAERAMREGIFTRVVHAYEAHRAKPIITIDFGALDDVTSHAGMLFYPQDRIERLLLDAVTATGLCTVHFATAVTSFTQDDASVRAVVTTATGTREISARYLIACDGAHSTIREQLGLTLTGSTYKARVLLADVRLRDAGDFPTPRLAVQATGPLVIVRFDDERWRVIGTLAASETHEHATSHDGIASRLRALAIDGAFDVQWASTFHIHSRAVDRMRVGSVFLAGDAAHLSSPAGGMGMNSGIEDAHNLAWKLAAALRGHDTALLDTYERERLYAIRQSVLRTSDVASKTLYFAPPPVRAAFLALFRVLMRVPTVRRRVLGAMGMLATRYPAAPGQRPNRWIGRIAPDCTIGTRRLLAGKRGETVRIAYGSAPPTHETATGEVRITDADGRQFARTWNARPPFRAVVRPDGFIAEAEELPRR